MFTDLQVLRVSTTSTTYVIPSGSALHADGLQVGGQMSLRNFRAEGVSEGGAVRLSTAHIAGNLECDSAVLINKSGAALHADGLQVDGQVFLRNNFRAEDASESGAVRLPGAHIGGSIDWSKAVLVNTSGPALYADRLQVGGQMFLRRLRAEGSSSSGTIQLPGAHIGGGLNGEGSVFVNTSGPALYAEGLEVDDSVYLRNGFRATGRGTRATIQLASAHIGHLLDFQDSRMLNPDRLALDMRSSSVSVLRLPGNALCRSGEQADQHSWKSDGQLDIDGFTYSTLAPGAADVARWLLWLRCYTPGYATQPYQQLAALHRAAGDEAAARRVLIAQQNDLLARGQLGGRRARLWHQLKRITVGYGYESWRALVGLAIVMVFAVGFGLLAGHIPNGAGRYVATRTLATSRPETSCSTIEQVGLGLNLGLPALNTGIASRCHLDTASGIGQAFAVFAWLLQATAWAFATLGVVGYTGLIRKI